MCLVLLLTMAAPSSAASTASYILTSPDGRLTASVQVNQGGMSYAIQYDNHDPMSTTVIGLEYEQGGKMYNKMTVRKVSRRTIDETIASPFSRQATMRNLCNEITLHLQEGLSVVFRAYNNGVAYRYVWEGEPGKVFNEVAQFDLQADSATVPYVSQFDSTAFGDEPFVLTNAWSPKSEKWKWFYPQYSSSFENQYTTLPLRKLDSRRLCFLPLLIHGERGIKMCITESALLDYPGMYLRHFTDGILDCQHAPLPHRVEQGGHNNLQLLVREREDYIAEMDRSKVFPWRIIMVGTDTAIAMNNLSYLLGEPSRLNDTSWIKPGKVAWDWWNCFNISGVDFPAGVNNDTYKHYIDFASRYGIEYVIIDEGWAVSGEANLFHVVPELDLPMLVQYAHERGVGIILWAGYYAFERDMERVCQHYSEMGVSGFKIDFMDRDDQLAVDFYRRAAETCARHHLRFPRSLQASRLHSHLSQRAQLRRGLRTGADEVGALHHRPDAVRRRDSLHPSGGWPDGLHARSNAQRRPMELPPLLDGTHEPGYPLPPVGTIHRAGVAAEHALRLPYPL